MRLLALLLPALILAFSIASVSDAEAARKGRYGKRTVYCQGDHLHYGSSDTFKSKRKAFSDAIASWAGFTVFEYGSEWGNWRLSRNKAVSCKKDSGLWKCSIQSTPCRKAKRGEKKKFR